MEKITDLRSLRTAIEKGGAAGGENTARKRINMLFDEGSFIETNAFAVGSLNEGAYADAVVTGYGTINQRPVCVYSQDLSSAGGSFGKMHCEKIAKTIDFAAKSGVPVIGIFDTEGLRLNEGLDAMDGLGNILKKVSVNSGVIPQISIVAGNLSGIAGCISAISDFTFMIKDKSKMFMNGPMVVKGYTNNDVENLGNAQFNAEKSGLASVVADDEASCIESVKKLLSYLPDNNLSDAPCGDESDDFNRISSLLNDMCTSENIDTKTAIGEIVDDKEFFEIKNEYAKNIITGFAHLGGISVGIVANNGALDTSACTKAADFVAFCDSFNIPVVTFANVKEFEASIAEEASVMKAASKLICAYAEATVPKINVILDKGCGGAYLAMGSKHIGSDLTLSWAGAEVSVMNSTAITDILYDEEISNSKNPKQERQAKCEEYKNKYANPFEAAKKGYVDDIIEPDSTRPRLISAVEILLGKREVRQSKKHSSAIL